MKPRSLWMVLKLEMINQMLRFIFLQTIVLSGVALLGPTGSYGQSSGAAVPFLSGGVSPGSNEASGQLNTFGASNGHPLAQALDPVFDFGDVYTGTTVKHTFRLKNAGSAPLTINAVRTSCGCTAAQPTKSNLLPGEESEIAASFDTVSDHGPATRTITVFTNDPHHQQVQLTMRGDVKVQVEANPSLVMFERIKRGTQQSRQLVLTDQMPDRTFKIGAITNENPNIHVESQPTKGGKPGAVIRITLLKTAPAGPIADLIKVTTSRVPVEIPVSGTVVGDINVNPPQISFGIVPHHASALRFVRLTNSGDHPVKITAISSNNTSVVAAVQPLETGKEYKISVRLAPNTPDGVLHGMLAIKTDDPHQQDVQVPFYGIVGSFRG
jgi:Protein of unknown function (DUF1573)